jgi:bifunctional non-homologous end joining protein LigD
MWNTIMQIKEQTLLSAPSTSGGKEYLVILASNDDSTFSVIIKNGPAGNLRQQPDKAPFPTIELAQKAYTKAIEAKLKGSGSSIYSIVSQTSPSDRVIEIAPVKAVTSPFVAQLLNSIDAETEVLELFASGDYVMQLKADGERMSILHEGAGVGQITAFNRKGQSRDVPQFLIDLLQTKGGGQPFYIDGEIVKDAFYAFDTLLCPNLPTAAQEPYARRFVALKELVGELGLAGDQLKAIPTVYPEDGVQMAKQFVDSVLAAGGEGVVLKKINSHYSAGRPEIGGGFLKFKFKESSTCLVTRINQQRSVGISLLDANANEVCVGNVTIPPSSDVPAIGDLIEVQYLYAFVGGSLFQPVYLGKRNDLDRGECTLNQIHRWKTDVQPEALAA